MRGKWVITKNMCKDIMNVLKQGKAGGNTGFDPQHRAWCVKYFRLSNLVDADTLCAIDTGKTVVMFEAFYHILREAHEQTRHGGRDKVRYRDYNMTKALSAR
ncbi:unnamed protein product [Didymodactylos carnosus]|uniref:Uncharacterized protein n=1 Tax=Didymodactylos carnosus TaxID=1234261 RepID=A0A814U653_9BILA|nr:unnamed protein product [Didymodactylos carnosus]CAF3934140.1 unnamed protein product [Didymodactylos carnosus]